MAKKASVALGKTYGSRYGKNIRDRVARIESEVRKKHPCPYCNYVQVKRVSAGIWHCKKCDAQFTGKAYSPGKKIQNPYALQSEEIHTFEAEKEEAKEETA